MTQHNGHRTAGWYYSIPVGVFLLQGWSRMVGLSKERGRLIFDKSSTGSGTTGYSFERYRHPVDS